MSAVLFFLCRTANIFSGVPLRVWCGLIVGEAGDVFCNVVDGRKEQVVVIRVLVVDHYTYFLELVLSIALLYGVASVNSS
jgi:hypothetical protein